MNPSKDTAMLELVMLRRERDGLKELNLKQANTIVAFREALRNHEDAFETVGQLRLELSRVRKIHEAEVARHEAEVARLDALVQELTRLNGKAAA